nr:unnamed protein product [Digitaria exilis]
MWRINCTSVNEPTGVYLGIFLELLSKSGSAKARFEAFLTRKDGEPSLVSAKRTGVHLFHRNNDQFGWPQFVKVMDLATDFVRDGVITFLCSIMVWHHSGGIPVPPSDIGENLGMLLDSTDGADVSFAIDGETFHAHRAVLAARSPVFRAELLGSMAEATMPSITLLDIAPETFIVLLSCPELRDKCIDFVVADKNFKRVALSEGFMQLGQNFPSIIAEVRSRVGT